MSLFSQPRILLQTVVMMWCDWNLLRLMFSLLWLRLLLCTVTRHEHKHEQNKCGKCTRKSAKNTMHTDEEYQSHYKESNGQIKNKTREKPNKNQTIVNDNTQRFFCSVNFLLFVFSILLDCCSDCFRASAKQTLDLVLASSKCLFYELHRIYINKYIYWIN